MEIIIIAAVWLAIAGGIYGAYRLIRYFERTGSTRDWGTGGGGAAYNPLEELVRPHARHIIEVQEQRVCADEEGGPAELDEDR